MKFSHEYTKLSKKIFTTIRRNNNFYKIGHTYQIQTPKQNFKAKVIEGELISKTEIDDHLARNDADMIAQELVVLLETWYGKIFDDFVLLTLERGGMNATKKDKCPHCESTNVEYSNYEWFCNNCGEQWDQHGQDTK